MLEHADTVGGRGGGVVHDGYWVDFGHRDGHDVGDCQVGWHHGVEAAREAGVDIALRRVTTPLRVHQLPDGRVTTGGDWSAAGLVAVAGGALALRHEDEAQVHAIVGLLTGAGPADVANAVPETIGAWLPRHTASAAVRGAVLFMAGHETTATTLAWAWYILSQMPQFEARLHAEIDQVLQGRPPSLADLPETADLVLLGVPDSVLAKQLSLAASRGDRSAVIFGGAYEVPETAPGTAGLRARLTDIAHAAGMAVCGAGCMGFVNVAYGLRAVGYVEPDPLPAGPIALITHSGSVFSAASLLQFLDSLTDPSEHPAESTHCR